MDEKTKLKITRRITLLYLIEGGDTKNFPLVDPVNYKEDIDALIEREFVKDDGQEMELTPKGKKLMKNISLEQKRRYRRYFFSH